MSGRNNLGTVIAFEVRRTLLKPSFWLTSLSIPLLMTLIFALTWFSQSRAASDADAARNEPIAFTYTDASGLVSPAVAERLGGTSTPDAAGAAQAVREGRATLHIDVPATPATEPVRIVGAEGEGLLTSGRYHSVARDLVQQSVTERIGDPTLVQLVNGVQTDAEMWSDGQRSYGIGSAVAPGIFLVMLFMTILLLGNQMLTITVEEKENRVTEMILTTIKPSALIVGKIIAVVIVGVIQGLVFLTPLVAALVLIPGLAGGAGMGSAGGLRVGGEPVVIAWAPILVSAGLFLGGFLLFTGLLVTIGAIMPTAKEAGSAFGAVILAMFMPLYAMAAVLTDPHGIVSRILTWFPLTAPTTALVRNATGSLTLPEAVGTLVVTLLTASLLLWWGVRLFGRGSIQYEGRLKVFNFSRTRSS